MCGIIGICLHRGDELTLGYALYKGLLRLEYRGYDSAGIGIITSDKQVLVFKKKGRITELEERYNVSKYTGVIGVGHTRWATHGPPSDMNAHPIVDCTGSIIVVHNGIIENYHEIKKRLTERGHVFRTETDTEVVSHLIEEYIREESNVYMAFKKAISELKGAYAILAITSHDPARIFFAKKDSPLVIGLGERYNVLASDIPAILDHTRRVIVVRDHWVGYVTPREVFIEDLASGVLIDPGKYIQLVEWSIEDASKEGYPHYMLKEIYEQPRALLQTISGLRNDPAVIKAIELISNASRVYVTGAGTSYHASEFFAYLSAKLAGKAVIPFIASEYEVYEETAGEDDVLVAVSQSGETIDVLKAVRAFKEKGVKIIAVSNIIGSAIPRESDIAVYTRAGPEIGVAATKTFLAQTTTLSWILLGLSRLNGILDRDEYEYLTREIEEASREITSTLGVNEKTIEELSVSLLNTKSLYYLSRGIGVPIAREGALKIKEIAYVHAEAYPAGESKHGPIALVELGFPVVFIVPNERRLESKIRGNIEEMRARGAIIIGIAHVETELSGVMDYWIRVPSRHWITTAITHTPPLQLLAYKLAVRKGLDPDKPRNLAKTVTVE